MTGVDSVSHAWVERHISLLQGCEIHILGHRSEGHRPDILIVPTIEAGNIFTKALTFYAHLKSAGTLNGTTHPVIMTSRTDTPEDKYDSILCAILKAI